MAQTPKKIPSIDLQSSRHTSSVTSFDLSFVSPSDTVGQEPRHRRMLTRKPERGLRPKQFNKKLETALTVKCTDASRESSPERQNSSHKRIPIKEVTNFVNACLAPSQLTRSVLTQSAVNLRVNCVRPRSRSKSSEGKEQKPQGVPILTKWVNKEDRIFVESSQGYAGGRELEGLKKQLRETRSEIQDLRKQNQTLKHTISDKEKFIEELEIRLRAKTAMEKCSRPTSMRSLGSEEQIRDLNFMYERLQKDNMLLKERMRKLESELQFSRDSFNNLQKQNCRLVSTINIYQSQCRSQQLQIKQLDELLHVKSLETEKLDGQIRYLNLQLFVLKKKQIGYRALKIQNQEKTYLANSNKRLRLTNLELRNKISALMNSDRDLFELSPDTSFDESDQ